MLSQPLQLAPRHRPGRGRPVRGSALVYLTIALVALIAFVSLGVDAGRVYVAKAELQLAADAAARHAAAGLRNGVAVAEANAIAAAADNKADGQTVVLNPALGDVQFGTWDPSTRQFTVLTGAARSGANAVRVNPRRTAARGNAVPLTWGALIGMPTCDIKNAAAIARAPAGGGGGFIGLTSISTGNNTLVAGYNSGAGAPAGGNVSDAANLGSNGTVDVGNNSTIRGDVLAPDLEQGTGGTLTGDQQDNLPPMVFPPTEQPTVPSAGLLNVPQDQTMTLPAGTHHYTTVTIGHGATLTFSGPATLYVSGSLTLGNNKSSLIAPGNLPGNLKVRLVGAASFTGGNDAIIVADVYGPQAHFELGNNAQVRGQIVALTVEFGNNALLYYDSTLPAPGGSGVALVK